jgi:hypothetical protein
MQEIDDLRQVAKAGCQDSNESRSKCFVTCSDGVVNKQQVCLLKPCVGAGLQCHCEGPDLSKVAKAYARCSGPALRADKAGVILNTRVQQRIWNERPCKAERPGNLVKDKDSLTEKAL